MTVRGLYPYMLRKISVCSFLFVFLCIVFYFCLPVPLCSCLCVRIEKSELYLLTNLPIYPSPLAPFFFSVHSFPCLPACSRTKWFTELCAKEPRHIEGARVKEHTQGYVVYECDLGFMAEKGKPSQAILRCNNGEWIGDIIECSKCLMCL